jgi:hypothetical protein
MSKKILVAVFVMGLLFLGGVVSAQDWADNDWGDNDQGALPDYGSLGDYEDLDADVNTDVKANTTIKGGAGGVQINAGGTKVNASKSGVLTVTVDGETVELNGAKGSLTVQAKEGLSEESRRTFVSLEGNSVLLIKTDQDLDTYTKLVVDERPSVKNVSVEDDGIEVEYRQPAKFLAVISSSLKAKVMVKKDGSVKVKLPWYSFLFSKDVDEVEEEIMEKIEDAVESGEFDVKLVGRGGASLEVGGDDDGDGVDSTIQFRNNAKALNVVTSSIDGSVGLSAE